MPTTDRSSLDPTAKAVEAALAEAVQQANYRAQKGKLPPDPAAYSACAAELASTPEGARVWIGGLDRPEDCRPDTPATPVGAARWTHPPRPQHAPGGRRPPGRPHELHR